MQHATVNSILEDAGCYRIFKNILKIQHNAVYNILEDAACYSEKHLSNQWELWIVLQVVHYATDREEWFCILYIAKNLMTLTFLGTHSVKH